MTLDFSKTACFTGHRPNVFVNSNNFKDYNQAEFNVKKLLLKAIVSAHEELQIVNFISGGAVGVDQWAAECVLDLKSKYPEFKLIIARPFPSQHIRWPIHVQDEYFSLLQNADDIITVSEDPYAAWKMHVRNEYMVNNSQLVIAVKYPEVTSGGTSACLQYAIRKNRTIWEINPRTEIINCIY